ncbi:MAG: hypothetical protein IJH25_04000 [Clostridia bacterium]|nr:hypothetical protein [Clostridia bacterium]
MMKKSIAWILAVLMLLVPFCTMAEETEETEKLAPLFATVGDALAAAGENPVAGGEEDYYAVVTETEGKYYRSVAEMDDKARELQAAITEADLDHLEAAFAAADDYIKTLPIAYSEMFTAEPMGQAEIDALIGKTLGELRETGYEDREWGTEMDENEEVIIVYVLRNGLFDYRCVVDVDPAVFEESQEGEFYDGDYAVKRVELRGITSEACFTRYHLDGTIEEEQDPFATFTEIAELIQEMIKKVQNGEDVNIEEFFSELKEQYPDLVDTIEMYWEIIKQFGVDQLAALLTSAE